MDDDELEFSSSKKKSAAKRGRRAKADDPPQPTTDTTRADTTLGASMDAEELALSNHTTQRNARDPDAPPRPSRRMGGWGDDNKPKSGRRHAPQDEVDNFEDERLRQTDSPEKEDSDNDIPVIPDLEDAGGEEDPMVTIAMAPNVAVNRVATYRELDNELLRMAAFQTLDNDIDLKVLTRCLAAESEVREEDKPWDWDRLFTEVSSELQTEWEIDDPELKEAVTT